MTTKEAIQAMLDGKKTRDVDWNKNEYIHFPIDTFVNEKGGEYKSFGIGHDCWEIYEEPKPKETVTIEKWLLKGKSPYHSGYFHIVETSDIDAYISAWDDSYKKVEILDTYEVEL